MCGCCSNDSTNVKEQKKINPQKENEKEKIKEQENEKEKRKEKEKDEITEEEKIDFKQEKFIKNIKIEEKNGIKIQKSDITLEVIHVNIIDSTMPAYRNYMDEGNKLPFLYNADIQTHGKEKGGRNWAGTIQGNLYISTCIPTNMIKNELNNNDILVKITALSIYEQIIKYAKKEFFLKYPNDILCKDKKKLGGILVQDYKDFAIIGFGINIVDKPQTVRKGGLPPCFIKEHLPEGVDIPNPVDLSIEITKNIFFNLNLTSEEISKLFDKYINENN